MEKEEILRRFLLGAVTDDEREQIQDQLFLPGGLFQQMLLMEDRLTDEYLYGELGGDDLVRFETYFLAAPQRRERLRMARALRQHASEAKLLRIPRSSTLRWI